MVTINNQWIEQIAIGVSLSFPVNCSHSKNIAFESSNTQGTPEFDADVQYIVTAYELNFKTSPDYSTQDLNLSTATWSIVVFDSNVGVVSVQFDVLNAEVTLNQYYGFPDEMSEIERQTSINEQVQQYEINYKNGYDLVDL